MRNTFKNLYKYLITSSLFIFLVNYSLAGVLSLQKIGTLDTGGKVYPEWWYTGTSPVLLGAADVGTDVTIKIGEASFTATPDASGAWNLATHLEKGDHSVQITQGEDTISFTLHLGQGTDIPSSVQPSGTEPGAPVVPDTGFNQYVAASFGMGIILLATYFYFSTDSKKKTIFESRMLKED